MIIMSKIERKIVRLSSLRIRQICATAQFSGPGTISQPTQSNWWRQYGYVLLLPYTSSTNTTINWFRGRPFRPSEHFIWSWQAMEGLQEYGKMTASDSVRVHPLTAWLVAAWKPKVVDPFERITMLHNVSQTCQSEVVWDGVRERWRREEQWQHCSLKHVLAYFL